MRLSPVDSNAISFPIFLYVSIRERLNGTVEKRLSIEEIRLFWRCYFNKTTVFLKQQLN
jgi:hypothetical protein